MPFDQNHQESKAKECLSGQSFGHLLAGINDTDSSKVDSSMQNMRDALKESAPLAQSLSDKNYKELPEAMNKLLPGDIVIFNDEKGQPTRAVVADYNSDLMRFNAFNLSEKTLPKVELLDSAKANQVTVYRKEFCVNKTNWDKFMTSRE